MHALCHVCSVRVFVALAFLLVASGERPARAQDAPRPGNDELWTAPGHWAMQFRVGQNFTLENFQGSFLSAQRWWSSRNALRFAVSLGFDAQDSSVGGNGSVMEERTSRVWTAGVDGSSGPNGAVCSG